MNQCQPNARSFLILTASVLLGLAGNHFNLSIGYNVHFIFGSIFCILILGVCGLRWALPATILTSSYTLLIWNHPYAIVIFTAEILWLGLWLRRGRTNILLIDSFYWLVAGIPLVILFYSGIMQLDFQITQVIALKQSVNGVLNALIASIVLSIEPLSRWLRKESRVQTSISQILFQVGVFFLIVPSIGLIMHENTADKKREETRIARSLAQSAFEKTALLNRWVDSHINAVRVIAELGNQYPLQPSSELQQELARIHSLFPDFHNIFLGSPEATTIAFHPAQNERGESTIGINFRDREWFEQLSSSLHPVVSKVFQRRGGIFQPIFSISVPLLRNGQFWCFGLGAVNLDRLKQLIDSGKHESEEVFYLTDEDNRVIFSNTGSLETMKSLDRKNDYSFLSTPVDGIAIRVPGAEENIAAMNSWRDAYFVTEHQIQNTGWTFHLEYPVEPLQTQLYQRSIHNLATIALIFIAALVLATWTGHALAKVHKKLVSISEDLPNKVARGESLNWPTSNIREIAFLIDNFRSVAEELGNRIKEIGQVNRSLEATVAVRTRELSASNQKLSSILETSPVAIAWATESGEIEYVNRKFTSLFGYTLADIPTVEDWALKAYPDPVEREKLSAEWEAELQKARREKRDLDEFDVVITGKDGTRHNISIVSTWSNDRILAFFTDYTERRHMEVKTLQIARLAALGEMAAGVAHEINNPLAGIVGCAELLRKKLSGQDDSKNLVDRILKEGERITRIVRSLLSTARPGQKRNKKFYLADCFDNVQILSAEKLNREGIDFSIRLPDKLEPISGEQQHIEQLLLNLINNSRHALNARFPGHHPDKKLSIKADYCNDSESNLRIEVYDQGIGIPEEIINRIFDPFFTTKATREGTGLGLVICYEIVKQMNGDIQVESEENKYTRFVVEIPLTGKVDTGTATPGND